MPVSEEEKGSLLERFAQEDKNMKEQSRLQDLKEVDFELYAGNIAGDISYVIRKESHSSDKGLF